MQQLAVIRSNLEVALEHHDAELAPYLDETVEQGILSVTRFLDVKIMHQVKIGVELSRYNQEEFVSRLDQQPLKKAAQLSIQHAHVDLSILEFRHCREFLYTVAEECIFLRDYQADVQQGEAANLFSLDHEKCIH